MTSISTRQVSDWTRGKMNLFDVNNSEPQTKSGPERVRCVSVEEEARRSVVFRDGVCSPGVRLVAMARRRIRREEGYGRELIAGAVAPVKVKLDNERAARALETFGRHINSVVLLPPQLNDCRTVGRLVLCGDLVRQGVCPL